MFWPEMTRRELFRFAGGEVANKLRSQETEPSFAADVLMYHEVSYNGLVSDILGRMRQGQQPLSPETFAKTLNGEVEIPWWSLQTFLVTMDDGLASQYYQGLPAFRYIQQETETFVPAMFFVMTKFNDFRGTLEEVPDDTPSYRDGAHRYMTKGQLIELIQEGYWVDNHTIDHANLPSLHLTARNAQVEHGQERIDALWKLAGREKPYKFFAYPNGSYRGQVEYMQDQGYDAAFSTIKTNWHTASSRFILGRYGRT